MRYTFEPDGTMRFIYDDELAEVAKDLGPISIRRASHVEPRGNDWFADMSPVGGPVLGPFETRREALATEVEWLRENRGL